MKVTSLPLLLTYPRIPSAINQWRLVKYLTIVHVAKQYLSVHATSAQLEFDYQFLTILKTNYRLWKKIRLDIRNYRFYCVFLYFLKKLLFSYCGYLFWDVSIAQLCRFSTITYSVTLHEYEICKEYAMRINVKIQQ